MKQDVHPHLKYWFAVTFGLDHVPHWYHHRKKIVTAVSHLWQLRQEAFYERKDQTAFKDARRALSMGYKLRYEHIDLMIGICMVDPSNPYGILVDFFKGSEPRITRTVTRE